MDVNAIRACFPALDRREAGHPVAYFDGPGGTQAPRVVGEAMLDYLYNHNANTHWAYASSAETDALLEGARRTLADFMGCAPNEVVFGQNMTTLVFHLTRALGRDLGPGDEIVVTRLDHQANVGPWKALVRDRGVTIREVPFDAATGTLDRDTFAEALSDRTRWVALGAASNAIGTVNDVAGLAAMAREAGARVFVDAVHYAPHGRMDVASLGIDALGCSPYKFYGPHAGVLFVRADLQERLDVPRLACAGSEPPEVLETGTLSHESIVGAAAAVDFLASLGDGPDRRSRLDDAFAALHHRGEALLSRLWSGLAAIPGVHLFGPPPGHPRTPTVGFTLEGHSSESITAQLSREHGIFTSHGDFYATTVIEDLGVAPDGLVRVGCACYTTEDEVDRLVAGVAAL